MPNKTSPSIIPRFTGKAGTRNLLAAVCSQQSVAGDKKLAQRLINASALVEFKAGKVITHQGDADNDIYLIISGTVSISINKRIIAHRSAGTHVGEMALLDVTARRSGTIITTETCALLKIPESEVTRIARAYPEFWRRIAVELGCRLRERSKFIHEPNPVPSIFIGSSTEALSESSYLSESLARRNLACKLWTQGVFQQSQITIEDLVLTSKECDFAILFLTPDDMTTSRGRKKASPRDNVVFELGLFIGSVGRSRTFIAIPRGIDIKLPTDLLGITHTTYMRGHKRSVGKRLRSVSKTFWKRIQELGPK